MNQKLDRAAALTRNRRDLRFPPDLTLPNSRHQALKRLLSPPDATGPSLVRRIFQFGLRRSSASLRPVARWQTECPTSAEKLTDL